MTVRKKGNKWYYRFMINGIEYERAAKGATSKKDAEDCEKVAKGKIMEGEYNFGRTRITPKLKDAIKLYSAHSKNNKKSYKNDDCYTLAYLDFWGNCSLEQITPASVENFKQKLKSKGNKNATINRYLQAFSKLFNVAIANNLIKTNPLKRVAKLKESNYKIRFLAKEEEKKLFEAIEYAQEVIGRDKKRKTIYPYLFLKNIVLCALQTGMRRGEILNLKWNNLDSKLSFIELLETKSGKVRKIPISEKLKTAFEELKTSRLFPESDFIFINPQTATKYVDIKKSFTEVLKKAEIENFRFHDLRHTVATRLVESGADLVVVQEILGHANIQTTMRYAHPVPERKKSAIDLLNSY